jgi:hypothetical protein
MAYWILKVANKLVVKMRCCVHDIYYDVSAVNSLIYSYGYIGRKET